LKYYLENLELIIFYNLRLVLIGIDELIVHDWEEQYMEVLIKEIILRIDWSFVFC
jgi:hypothetical protein